MIHDDWLMRQLNGFAAGLARLIAGETVAVEEAEIAFESLFGTSPQMLATMSEGALFSMVRRVDGLDPIRALALGLGIAQVSTARARALSLIDAALAEEPELATEALLGLRASLVRGSV